MEFLRISMFGKLKVALGEQILTDSNSRKAWELFCYLLLHRDHPHPREALANLQWDAKSTTQSKKYLRQTLWQLQSMIAPQNGQDATPVLLLDPEWVHINPQANLWLDVAAFEQAYDQVRTVPGHHLDEQLAQTLRDAVGLYRGELLAGWYQDWCLYERERFQGMYLAMLDKLLAYCEVHHEYQAGLAYGEWALRCDRARERTHRRMMRLYCLAGNRTEALHQYRRCVMALKTELGVIPAERTVALYEQIREGHLPDISATRFATASSPQATTVALAQVLARLQRLQTDLAQAQQQVQQDIQTITTVLQDPR